MSRISRLSFGLAILAAMLRAPLAGLAQVPPEGKILFFSKRDGNYGIYVMNPDGGDQRKLAANVFPLSPPMWSPDGREIVFTGFNNNNKDTDIFVVNLDGGGLMQLTFSTKIDDAPVWSPKGDKIAFYSFQDDKAEIYIMNPDGSNQMRLTDSNGHNMYPVWSPDGDDLYFFSNYPMDVLGIKTGIYRVSLSGGVPVRISKDGKRITVSPDGLRIAYIEGKLTSTGSFTYTDAYGMPQKSHSSNSKICKAFVIDGDGKGRPKNLGTIDDGSIPHWSPDGTRLAFVAGYRVYIINADGKGKKITIHIPFAGGSVSWSPDGNWIVCTGRTRLLQASSIFLASVDGKEQKMLTENTGDFCPVWSPCSIQ